MKQLLPNQIKSLERARAVHVSCQCGRAGSPASLSSVVSPTNIMRYEIEIMRSEPIRTAVVRSRVRPEELSQFVPAACGEIWSFIRSAGLPRPGRHLALYLDAQGSVEVGAEVSEPFAGNDRVQRFTGKVESANFANYREF